LEPTAILYAKCDIAAARDLVVDLCNLFGYGPWTLQGHPSTLQVSSSAIAMRIAIFNQQVRDNHNLSWEEAIGTAHIIKVSPDRTRICFRHDDLAGRTLPFIFREKFNQFCAWFDRMLNQKELGLSDFETGGSTVRLDRPDTGPLAA
jgi:hypothetical protein